MKVVLVFLFIFVITTITVKSPLNLDRFVFQDVDDLLMTLFHLRNAEVAVDFHELNNEEVSSEVLQKVNLSKEKPLSSFTSVSSV